MNDVRKPQPTRDEIPGLRPRLMRDIAWPMTAHWPKVFRTGLGSALSTTLFVAVCTFGAAEADAAKTCRSVTSSQYAKPHSVTFFVGGTADCAYARKWVGRITASHGRRLPPKWRCQVRVGGKGGGGNGECRRSGRSFYWGVED
jgi:hypothetical protein